MGVNEESSVGAPGLKVAGGLLSVRETPATRGTAVVAGDATDTRLAGAPPSEGKAGSGAPVGFLRLARPQTRMAMG